MCVCVCVYIYIYIYIYVGISWKEYFETQCPPTMVYKWSKQKKMSKKNAFQFFKKIKYYFNKFFFK